MSFRKDFVCLTLLVGVMVLLYLSPAFCAAPAGFAGKWKLNTKESDDVGKKFEEAFRKKEQDNKDPNRYEKALKPKGGPAGEKDKKNRNPFEAPGAITIETGETSVTVTDSRGSRTYFTDGRKTEQDMGKERTMIFHAHWDEDALVVESQGRDGGTVTESYYLSEDKSQLFVKLQMHPIFLDEPVTIISVYDPTPAQTQTQTQPL